MQPWNDERPPQGKLTYDDFLSFPDDGLRHELIDGEHYVTPSPATRHQRIVGEFHLALATFLKSAQLGEVFLAPFDVLLSRYDVVEPDLLVILGDQPDILTEKHVVGAPAIVIEILSPGTRRRDETLKRRLYERVGVREYWMVDPDVDAIAVCRPGQSEVQLGAGDVLTSALLPGFEVRVASLFAPRP
jgi:Uma2 family endonuclease